MAKKKASSKVAAAEMTTVTVSGSAPAEAIAPEPLLESIVESETEVDPGGAIATALTTLDALRVTATKSLNGTQDPAGRGALNDLLDRISAEKTELNSAAIQGHTISLQAASDELQPGIDDLTALKAKLAALTQAVKNADQVISGVVDAIQGVQAVLKTFP